MDDIKKSQLRGYLGDFYVKPDMSSGLWSLAQRCLSDSKTNAFGFSFTDEVRMRQFGLAVLLSAGRQLNWYCAGSYKVLQDNLAGDRLLTGYSDFDCVFIVHNRGTMKNGIMGQTINQISILRAPKKTFFFDLGGPTIPDLIFQVRPVSGGSVGGRGFDV